MSSDESDNGQDRTGGLSTGAWQRNSRLLKLPLGAAARRTAGWRERLTGSSAEEVKQRQHDRAAEQLFAVLGELKGGAMKIGQMFSMFETVLPDDIAEPYRVQLAKLQASAPPMPLTRVLTVLNRELGADWRDLLTDFSPTPAAAASIGQVHRATWRATGQPVAVKVQYPGADQALTTDLRQLERMAQAMGSLTGGIDIVPVVREFAARTSEEVDYDLEAASQQQAADAFHGDPDFVVPRVLAHSSRVMVSEWIGGQPLSTVATLPEEERNRIALQYVRFLFAGPARSGLLHGDPHPGNFLVLPDGRLGIIDFGLVNRLPQGLPYPMGELLRHASRGEATEMLAGLRREGFIAQPVGAEELLDYLSPFIEPAQVPTFHFTRDWMREQFLRVQRATKGDGITTKLNLPPSYVLIHRVWLGGVAVLSQLDVRAPFSSVLDQYLPGWSEH